MSPDESVVYCAPKVMWTRSPESIANAALLTHPVVFVGPSRVGPARMAPWGSTLRYQSWSLLLSRTL